MPDKPRAEKMKADALDFGVEGLNPAALEYYHAGWECYRRSEFADMDLESYKPDPDEILQRRTRLHLLRALGIYDDALMYWFMVDEIVKVEEVEALFPYDESRFHATKDGSDIILAADVEAVFWNRVREIIANDLVEKRVDPGLALFVKNHYSPDDLKRIRGLNRSAASQHIKNRMKKWIAEE